MNRSKLSELIRNGENSGVEFKRADVRPGDLAKEMSALLNHEGGWILLGVDDNGEISGLISMRSRIATTQLSVPVSKFPSTRIVSK